jgi:N-acyl homoserine lactone hydrolase
LTPGRPEAPHAASGHPTRPQRAPQGLHRASRPPGTASAAHGAVGDTQAVAEIAVRRLNFGYFIRPAEETGTGAPRVEPVLGYLIEHPDGPLLVDTGMGHHPEVDAWYQPHRIDVPTALAAVGTHINDIRFVVNCHLHFDHCGGNPLFPGRPIVVQHTELAAARTTTDYTLPTLVDHPGAHYEQLAGEAEILPGIRVIPTPGHTAGHQSVVVKLRDGTVIVAGQSHDNATLFTSDALASQAGIGTPPPWLPRLLALDPRQVLFAHDNATWTP